MVVPSSHLSTCPRWMPIKRSLSFFKVSISHLVLRYSCRHISSGNTILCPDTDVTPHRHPHTPSPPHCRISTTRTDSCPVQTPCTTPSSLVWRPRSAPRDFSSSHRCSQSPSSRSMRSNICSSSASPSPRYEHIHWRRRCSSHQQTAYSGTGIPNTRCSWSRRSSDVGCRPPSQTPPPCNCQ